MYLRRISKLKMEVTGGKGSADSTPLCQPCQGEGDTEQAEGYCENCNQYICSSCIKVHRKFAGTKHHVIKSKAEMPKLLTIRSDPCTELCDVHKNEIVKYYCKEHDSVGCRDCMVLDHTSCKVQLVADVSCNYDDNDELFLIKHRIKHIKKNLDSCKKEIGRSLQSADEIKTSIIKEIQQFRNDMDIYLDKVTTALIQEVEKLNASDVSRQQKLQAQCKEMTEDIKKMQKKLGQCKDNVNDLFVSSKRVQNKLQKCQEMNEEISAKSQIKTFKFTPTKDLNTLKINSKCLGSLDTHVKTFSGQCEKSIIDMKTYFVQRFNMKGKNESGCGIFGLTIISEAEILCADCNNTSLKVFNHKEGKITSTLKMSSRPACVATINSSSAATTLPYEGKILFLNTQNGLSTSHSITVRERCYGIDHHNGIMAVTFVDPPAVQMIDMEGHILHDVTDTSILKIPDYVCLSNDNKSMFVSDWENAAVFEFTLKGRLINTIKSEEFEVPAGLAVTKCGSVVVCDPTVSDKVGVIVPGRKEILPVYLSHVLNPHSLVICEEQRKMFISSHGESLDSNFINIFDLK